MALYSRFYPTTKLPHVGRLDGRPRGAWNNVWSEQNSAYLASPSKTDGGVVTNGYYKTNQQGDYDGYLESFFIGPLNAQTISGTYNHCMAVMAQWLSPSPTSPTADSIVRYQVHVYITVGHSTTVRHTLIDNYTDNANFPGPLDAFGAGRWAQFGSAPTMTSGSALDGDYIRIEVGARVVSSPTPTPNYAPAETWTTDVHFRHFYGTTNSSNVAHPDAVAGNPYDISSGWFNFSSAIDVNDTPVAAPSNDDCSTPIIVSSFPYTSPRIDTSQSADLDRAVWFKFTAPTTGEILLSTYGSTYRCAINVYDDCGSFIPADYVGSIGYAAQRGLSVGRLNVTSGVEYWVEVASATYGYNAINSGGSLQFNMDYRDTPQEDDLYLPCGHIAAFRDGHLVNVNPLFLSSAPSGVVIDYSGITMNRIDSGTNSGTRLIVGLHSIDAVEWLAIEDLDFGEFQTEIDFAFDPWDLGVGLEAHPAQLAIDRTNNQLYVAFFGNGYLYIDGFSGSFSGRPAVLNTISDDTDYSAIRRIGVAEADSQPGAPFTPDLLIATPEVTAPWAVSLDEVNGIIYFTSGSFYVPVGGQEIRIYNINTGITTTFATLTLAASYIPGLRGLQLLPGSDLLVCNGSIVQRLNSGGTVIGTYYPSDVLNSQTLTDVKMTVDGTRFWTVDYASTKLYLVDLATMTEIAAYDTWLLPGTLTQMAIYQPSGTTFPVPPAGTTSESEDCPDRFLIDPPAKPLPKFLQVHGFLNQAPASSGVPIVLGNAPSSPLRSRFRG